MVSETPSPTFDIGGLGGMLAVAGKTGLNGVVASHALEQVGAIFLFFRAARRVR